MTKKIILELRDQGRVGETNKMSTRKENWR